MIVSMLGCLSFCKWSDCRGCASSSRHLPPSEAVLLLRAARRDGSSMTRLRQAVSRTGVMPFLCRMSDEQVISQASSLMARGELVVCGDALAGGAEPGSVEASTALRLLRGPASADGNLDFEGRTYRLIAASDWQVIDRHAAFQLVGTEAARQSIARMVAAETTDAARRHALEGAAALLVEPDAGPARPGLLLLVRQPRLPACALVEPGPRTGGAGSTPPLLRRARASHWVQFNVVDKAGKPVAAVPYRLQAPSGHSDAGSLPASGRIRRDDVETGTFTLELAELRSAGWEADGQAVEGALPLATPLTLVARSRHVPVGTEARFSVFRLFDEEPGRALATATGQVQDDGSVRAAFSYAVDDGGHGREVALIHACAIGKLWIKSAPLTLRRPRLAAPRWDTDELTVGETATLEVDCPGLADGQPVQFTICRADTGAAVATLAAVVDGEAASAAWVSVDPDPETPESELFFDVECQGLKVRSRLLRLLDDVELVFVDEDGAALADARVTLEFGDGACRVCQLDASGTLRLTDPRARTARVIVAGAKSAEEATSP